MASRQLSNMVDHLLKDKNMEGELIIANVTDEALEFIKNAQTL